MVQKPSTINESIAVITFHLQVVIYKKNQSGELQRISNKYFNRNEPYKVVAVHENAFELTGGLFTVESGKPHFSICYGKLICMEKTPVCSKIGTILRYAEPSTVFNVTEVLDGVVGIGNREFISLKNAVDFKVIR